MPFIIPSPTVSAIWAILLCNSNYYCRIVLIAASIVRFPSIPVLVAPRRAIGPCPPRPLGPNPGLLRCAAQALDEVVGGLVGDGGEVPAVPLARPAGRAPALRAREKLVTTKSVVRESPALVTESDIVHYTRFSLESTGTPSTSCPLDYVTILIPISVLVYSCTLCTVVVWLWRSVRKGWVYFAELVPFFILSFNQIMPSPRQINGSECYTQEEDYHSRREHSGN